MFYHVQASSLSKATEEAMILLYENGISHLRENQDRQEQMREIQLVIDVETPLAEPAISKAMPCGINTLVEYEDEFVKGTADDLGWKYTYHGLYSPYYDKAVQELRRNPNSRRACIALGQGDINFTQDPPCLQLIMFNIVNGLLEVSVVFRSNDGVKAFPMNIQAVAALQRKMSGDLGCPVGALHYIANNFHCYHNDYHLLESYIKLFKKYDTPELEHRKSYSWEQYEKAKLNRNRQS